MFSYSGLARMASRVRASGAWLRTSSSHDCLVSSMAAHSSPRGSIPASGNRAGGTWVSTLPNRSSPRALASRRAGSTVMTSTFPPRWAAAMAAADADVVVLPTPPDPQQITISLAASSGSSDEAGGADGEWRAAAIGVSVPQLGRQSLGDLARGPDAVGALEQLGHVQQLSPGREPSAQLAQVLGPGAAHLDRQIGPVEHGFDRPPDRVDQGGDGRGLAQRPEHLLLAPGEPLGQPPADDHRGGADGG